MASSSHAQGVLDRGGEFKAIDGKLFEAKGAMRPLVFELFWLDVWLKRNGWTELFGVRDTSTW